MKRSVIACFQDLWSFLLLSSAFRVYPTGTEDFWSLRTIWSGSWCQTLACSKLFTCVHCITEQRHQYLARTSGHHCKVLNRFSSSKSQRNLTENLETVNFPSISVLDHSAFISKYLLPLSDLPHANGVEEPGITNFIFQLFAHAIIVVGNSSKAVTFPFKVFLQIPKDFLLYSQTDDK